MAGVLIAPVGDVLPKLRVLKDHGTSVVIIDRKAGADEFSSVSVNDEQIGWLVADHLIGQGARRIAVIGGTGSLRQVRHRLHGTQQRADRPDGVAVEFLDTGAMDNTSGRETVQRLLERPGD